MARPTPEISAAVAAAAEAINSPRTLSESLHAIVDVARGSIPGFDHAGISVIHPDGRIETLAGTDQLVWGLDALQYESPARPSARPRVCSWSATSWTPTAPSTS